MFPNRTPLGQVGTISSGPTNERHREDTYKKYTRNCSLICWLDSMFAVKQPAVPCVIYFHHTLDPNHNPFNNPSSSFIHLFGNLTSASYKYLLVSRLFPSSTQVCVSDCTVYRLYTVGFIKLKQNPAELNSATNPTPTGQASK